MPVGIITVQAAGNPDGVHSARFVGVEAWQGQNDFGPALRWQWVIVSPGYAGSEISTITAARCTPKNRTGMVIGGLAGKGIQAGEPFDAQQCVGRVYTVVIQGGKIVGVSPAPQPPQQQ